MLKKIFNYYCIPTDFLITIILVSSNISELMSDRVSLIKSIGELLDYIMVPRFVCSTILYLAILNWLI